MDTRKKYCNGLRAIADFYEAHPEIETPYGPLENGAMNSKEDAAKVIRALGNCTKDYSDKLFCVTRDFGGLELRFQFWRDQVCVRKVVGTREIPEQVIEAHVIPAKTEEIVEWECGSILAPAKETEMV